MKFMQILADAVSEMSIDQLRSAMVADADARQLGADARFMHTLEKDELIELILGFDDPEIREKYRLRQKAFMEAS